MKTKTMEGRQIKFRAWSTMKEPKMLFLVPGDTYFDSNDLIERDDWKVMQFTGLQDKNKKDIYEGDILRSETNDEDSACGAVITSISEVCFGQHPKARKMGDYLASFCMYSPDYYDEHAIFYRKRWTHEVIGNIYENPELFKNI